MIAILGPRYTYSDFASQKIQLPMKRRYCRSIGAVFRSLQKGTARFGFVPFSNSYTGEIPDTKKYLKTGKFIVLKKVTYPVQHCLAVKSDQCAFKKIVSHEQAFFQCAKFLKKNFQKIPLLPVFSTAGALRMAKKDANIAAIGSPKTADLMGLKILARAIQDKKNNKTTFVFIKRK